jgi:hypothetical protein
MRPAGRAGRIKLRLRLGLLAVIVAGLAVTGMVGAPGAFAASLSWSTPKLIDQQPPWAASNEINGMSCPSPSLCVAASDNGKMLTSTDPQDGAAATWSENEVDTDQQITAVSCPSTTFCVAVDGAGNIVSSQDPADGRTATWSMKAGADGTNVMRAVSCVSTALCVAVDEDGAVITSTDPADGASAKWLVRTLDGGGTVVLSGVSCPTAGLCVAVDWNGNDVVSADPGDGATAKWTVTDINKGTRIQAISCPSTLHCFAADVQGDVLTTRDPLDGAGATWTSLDADGTAQFRSISCPSAVLCVAVDSRGSALTSDNPAAGAKATWTKQTIEVGGGFFFIPSTVSCVPSGASAMCVAGDLPGRTFTTSDPQDGATATWAMEKGVAGENALVGMSCPTSFECVAVDNSGNALRTADPGDGAGATWNTDAAVGGTGGRFSAVSCLPDPTGSDAGQVFCIAADQNGAVVSAVIPTGAAPTWKLHDIDGTATINGISCASLTLCVAVDENGNILTSANPTANSPSWSSLDADGTTELGGVSCPTSSLCAAVDDQGNVLTSTNPADKGSATWKTKSIDDGQILNGVACQSACVAVDGLGNILTSNDPGKGAGATWTSSQPDGDSSVSAVTCPSTTLCMAVDQAGEAVSTTDPGAATPAWTVQPADFPGGQLSSIACVSAELCAAGDQAGNAMIGAAYTLDVAVAGDGTGKVTNGDGSISCPGTCSGTYGAGTKLTLSATASAGSKFTGWSGGGCSGTGACSVTMNGDQSLTATFVEVQTLTVTLSGGGSGNVTSADGEIVCPGSCSNTFTSGTVVTLTATASSGSTFTGWSGGGCSGTGICTVTMNGDQAVTAAFASNPTLDVNLAGAGAGSVSDGGAISCPSGCSAAFAPGTTVTLTATASSGATFTGWSGGGCSGTGTCTVTMNGDQTVTASFAVDPRLTVLLGGAGGGQVAGGGLSCAPICTNIYPPGTVVTLTATPAGGSTFAGWSGGCSGTGVCLVTMGSDQSVTASFETVTSLVKPARPSCTLKTDGDRVSAFPRTRRDKHHRLHRVAPKRTLILTARCNQAAGYTLTGTLKRVTKSKGAPHRRHTRTFHLHLTGHAAAGKSVRLTVKLPAAALAHSAQDSVSFTLSASDAAGSAKSTAGLKHLVLF